MRNVSICGAAETLLIDRMCLKTHCRPILDELSKLGCEIIGDKTIKKFFTGKMKIDTKKDWNKENQSLRRLRRKPKKASGSFRDATWKGRRLCS